MKAMVFESIGGPLFESEVAEPKPEKRELLIAIHAASVNPADYKVRQGLYAGASKLKMPHISGRDFSGVVLDVGEGVDDFTLGDEVFGVLEAGREGTYAEYVCEKSDLICKKPKFLTHEEASALALTGLTAIVSLKEAAKLKAREKVLIHGGAGGVGSFAIQYAKHIGAIVVTTASQHNHNYLSELGADQIIDYNLTNFWEQVSDCDVVFDTVGFSVHEHSYSVLKSGGRLVYIAPQPDNFLPPRQDVEIIRPKVGRSRDYLEQIIELAKSKKVIPPEIEIFGLAEAMVAQDKISTGHVRGKLILKAK